MPAVSSAGTRASACSIIGSKWSQLRIEQREMEARRNAVDRPGDRVRLVAAHHQAADLLLEVDQPVGIAQRRQVARHAGDRLGDHVLVLHRCSGTLTPASRPISRAHCPPQFTTTSQAIVAVRRRHAGHAPALDLDRGDRRSPRRSSRRRMRAPLASACVMSDGIGLPVGRQEHRADDIGRHPSAGHSSCASARRQQVHLAGRSCAPSSPGAGSRSSAPALQASRRPPLRFQPVAWPVSASSRS